MDLARFEARTAAMEVLERDDSGHGAGPYGAGKAGAYGKSVRF